MMMISSRTREQGLVSIIDVIIKFTLIDRNFVHYIVYTTDHVKLSDNLSSRESKKQTIVYNCTGPGSMC